MTYEKKILTYLVDHYRNSKKDIGSNKTNRRTQVTPTKFYKKYDANDGDFEEIRKLEKAVKELTDKGFITINIESFGTQIQCIYLVDEKILEIEQYIGNKYGYVSKEIQIGQVQLLIDRYQNASPICKKECTLLANSIASRKIPKNYNELGNIFKAIEFIEHNRDKLYIREASINIYGDSKFFEDETLQPVCTLLHKYSNMISDESCMNDEILAQYHIFKEPQKLCIKGKAVITISGKEIDVSVFSEGVEFTTSELTHIESIKIVSSKFMTIENRTSYLRYQDEDVTTFYLGGYANRYQRDFVKLIYHSNPDIAYMHFGDIDAGGFWIHHNLCEITGIDFSLFCMSSEELKNEVYASCLHSLTENDQVRLRELSQKETYSDVVRYMLEHNIKLEQEIISLELMKKCKVE